MLRFRRIDELMSEPSPPTIEERLERLPSDLWSVEQFETAAVSLVTTGHSRSPSRHHHATCRTSRLTPQFMYAQEYVDAAAANPRCLSLGAHVGRRAIRDQTSADRSYSRARRVVHPERSADG